MEDLITSQHKRFHFESWQLQLEISGLNVSWVREVLVKYTKGVWKVLIRSEDIYINAFNKITK